MFRKLGVAQDVLAELQAVSVLLVFVASLERNNTADFTHQASEGQHDPQCSAALSLGVKCQTL